VSIERNPIPAKNQKLRSYRAWSVFSVAYGALFWQAKKWKDGSNCFIVFVPKEQRVKSGLRSL